MDLNTLQSRLSALPLGELAYFDQIGSTNEYALHWKEGGAQHLSLVVSDEQTAGRGRSGRTWFTPPGSALAFSLVLDPEQMDSHQITRITGLGALAVCQVLFNVYGLEARIKWPNDVLVGGRKLAGVLAEAGWQGDKLQKLVLGIGINVARDSVPPESELNFPATSVATTLGRHVDRWDLLKEVLEGILSWLPNLDQPGFLRAWEGNLAYHMEWVQLTGESLEPLEGRLIGLENDGSLRLELPGRGIRSIQVGEVRMRMVDRS